jgi:hypothetical protein
LIANLMQRRSSHAPLGSTNVNTKCQIAIKHSGAGALQQ